MPTDTNEVSSAQNCADIAGSWAGGIDGMAVTDRFLQDVEVPSSFSILLNIFNDNLRVYYHCGVDFTWWL